MFINVHVTKCSLLDARVNVIMCSYINYIYEVIQEEFGQGKWEVVFDYREGGV